MPKAQCPTCASVVTYVAGYDPICPNCGFRGEAPAPAAPARWGAVPEPLPVAAPVPAYAPGYGYARPGNGSASAGLVLGILGLVFFWIPVVGALLAALGAALGGAGLAAAERDPALAHSRGTAITGLVLGGVGLILGLTLWGGVFGWDEPFWWD